MKSMLNAQIIIEQLQKIKPHLQSKFNVNEIALFGSYARNEQTEKSDIDFMINLTNSSYTDLCGTLYTLENLFPQKKIQVVSKKGIKPKYFEAIKSDLIYV
jgi:predicted nucleotidyltransferase